MSSWHSYPSIFNLGHRAVASLLNVPHYIEEKVDGSQFSFGLIEEQPSGDIAYTRDREGNDIKQYELRIRSKGAVMNVDAPEKMFTVARDTVLAIKHLLNVGWTYRAEYLRVPGHNTLIYDRVPKGNLVIFDVNIGEEDYLGPDAKAAEADRLGLECVPVLATNVTGLEQLRGIIDNTTSFLGGQKIEGIVVKQMGPDYLYSPDHKALIGKFVSERFREAHVGAWKEKNPMSGDILIQLGKKYCTQARWMKAIQHLREAGQLEDSPKDIGKLLIEVAKDMGQEEKEAIQKDLWRWAHPHITRAATRGFAEFYKNELLRRQFEQGGGDAGSTESATVGDPNLGAVPAGEGILVEGAEEAK